MTDLAAVRRVLKRLRPTWNVDQVADVRFQTGGYSNQNYRLLYENEAYVLRINQHRQPGTDYAHEARWLVDLPAGLGPELVAYEEATGCMLTRCVEGELLIDYFARIGGTPAFFQQIDAYAAHLHSTLPATSRRYDLAQLASQYLGVQPRDLPWSQPPASRTATCHNDLNPWNIVVGVDGWTTLDWEFVGSNDPVFDRITLLAGLGLAPEAVLDQLQDPRAHALLVSFYWRELAWAYYQVSQGNKRQEILQQWATMESYLAALKAPVPHQWRYKPS